MMLTGAGRDESGLDGPICYNYFWRKDLVFENIKKLTKFLRLIYFYLLS